MVINTKHTVIAVFFLACIAVLSQWDLFTKGVFSVGLNSTFVGAIFWFLLLRSPNRIPLKHDWAWYLPLWLTLLSFAIFENPWLKVLSVILLPVATGYIYSFRQIPNCDSLIWERALANRLIRRTLSPVKYLSTAKNSLFSCFKPRPDTAFSNIVRKSFIGVLMLLSLLTSADANFGEFIDIILKALLTSFDLTILFKAVLIVISTILILATLLAWRREINPQVGKDSEKHLDDIVVGIVVAGILVIYIAFLFFQIEYLLINELPTNFLEAEKIVKSGFWQLFLLSFINALMFFIVYKNTSELVQVILRAFILASGFVVLSGCWRMGMYVYWYGFSYEKFFASYTALYALLIFSFLSIASFSNNRKDIFCFITFTSLWFYAVATLLPIEKIIFHSNVHFSKKENSRVDLFHLTDLSLDIMPDVKRKIENGDFSHNQWSLWLLEKELKSCNGPWFEINLSRLLNCKR